MKEVEIHIDFTCPFSNMGGERFIQYLESKNLPLSTVRFRSFQLSPNKDNENINFILNMSNKFNKSVEETIKMYENITQKASELGLKFDVEKIVDVNSKNAHIGLQYATMFGRQAEYFRRIMSARFERGEDYSKISFIENVIKDLGLDVKDFSSKLEELNEKVSEDIKLAQERNIRGVPTFVQDGKILPLESSSTFEEFDNILK